MEEIKKNILKHNPRHKDGEKRGWGEAQQSLVPAAIWWIAEKSQTLEKEITAQDWKKVDRRPQEQDGSLTLRAKNASSTVTMVWDVL